MKDCHNKEKVENPRCINCNELGHATAWKGCSKYPQVKNTTKENSTRTQTTLTFNKVNENFLSLALSPNIIKMLLKRNYSIDHLFNQLQTANNRADKLYLLLNGSANQPSVNNLT
ncbi:hypothetical protein CEXT_100561 [Caerostris extrusa]|uniref:Uncharacterized protein n=1 Tax=Caerostris extrusa TaxID=172846 RepID=A0AAV4UFL4_CAEEX|nr:hypothetical protein CEXT_100561 [Caerostris extrusa]